MKLKKLALVILIAILTISLYSCKKKEEPQEIEVKSKQEYKQQAEKEISEENMDEELQKLQEEIESETETQ